MRVTQTAEMAPSLHAYRDNHENLADELRKLDLLIQLRVLAMRQARLEKPGLASDPRVYISHQEVDLLLSQDGPPEVDTGELEAIRQQIVRLESEIKSKTQATQVQGVFLGLPQLAQLFGLSAFELQAVIICLAPELRRKYDQLYAYVQNDIRRKRPSVDLVLDLLCETEADRWKARTLFSPESLLLRSGILQPVDDPQSPSGSSGLAQLLALDPRILNYILGNNSLDQRLSGLARLFGSQTSLDDVIVDPRIKKQVSNLVQHHLVDECAQTQKLVLHLFGPYGVGKQEFAQAISGRLGCPLLCLDVESLLGQQSDVTELLGLVYREAVLLQAAIYVKSVDALLREERQANLFVRHLEYTIVEYGWLTFLAGERPWHLRGAFEYVAFESIQIPMPNLPLREIAWRRALDGLLSGTHVEWAKALASRFQLSPGQVRNAANKAENHWAMGNGSHWITLDDLYAACRHESNQKLTELAAKIEPHYGWDDIILPDDKLDQLREVCNHVKYRDRVFGDWGFGQKLANGKGLSVLFSGPPGTGKTMAAEVIAHELRLDLYKIDLSGVVSKYVGETEKNLARVFQEAETSNAILFFDEADALFGKRTQVRDAHDRYANIESSYLLQKMEDYDGMVILATNLRENMDDAFTRRFRFVVEFPFPDAQSREAIWQTHIPSRATGSTDTAYRNLSKQMQITGGNIRNIILNAAFLAAANGEAIEMDHILRGSEREFVKIGKLWSSQIGAVAK